MTQPTATQATQIQPIVSLTPFCSQNWVIKGVIVDKTPLKTVQKNDKKFFSFTLKDDSESIRITCWNEAMYSKIEVNKGYIVSKGSVRQANRKFNPLSNEYEITLGDEAVLTETTDVTKSAEASYSFVAVSQLPSREVGVIVDVCGVIVEGSGAVTKVLTRQHETISKATFTIADKSNLVEITVWGDTAERFSLSPGTVVAVKGARIGHYGITQINNTSQKCTQLSLTKEGSVAPLEPSGPLAAKVRLLKLLYESQDYVEFDNISKSNMERLAQERYPLSYIQDKDLGSGGVTADGKPIFDFLSVRGHITAFKIADMYYNADKDGRKVAEGDPAAEIRYLVSVLFSDATTQKWVTMFNDTAKGFFQKEAKELKRLKEEDDDLSSPPKADKAGAPRVKKLEQFVRGFSFTGPVVIRLRIRQEEYNGERRPRCVVQRVDRIGQKTNVWKREMGVMIRDIKRYLDIASVSH